MYLSDEWSNRKSLADDFERAMAGPQPRKGNPAQTIDYTGLKTGEEITLEKRPKNNG